MIPYKKWVLGVRGTNPLQSKIPARSVCFGPRPVAEALDRGKAFVLILERAVFSAKTHLAVGHNLSRLRNLLPC